MEIFNKHPHPIHKGVPPPYPSTFHCYQINCPCSWVFLPTSMICNIGQTNATSYSDCTITVMCHNSSIVVLIMLSKRHHCSGRTLTVKCITLNAICIVYLHCSWFHSCLLVASFYLLHYNVFGLFQPIKAKCKQT